MGFYTITNEVLNRAFTENGDKAYASTGSACLDYFSIIGGMRYNLKDAMNLFMKSYFEDPLLTIKILFYIRDIKEGLGERNLFRVAFNSLANMYPEVAKQLIQYIPKYGRYDDLLVCLDTCIAEDVISYIHKQITEDLANKKEGKPISLMAKWLPSINTSSKDARALAKKIANGFGITCEEYRKILSTLRKGIIIENNLREKDYSFSYETVPGGAMIKYREAFIRNDKERYDEYLDSVKTGKVKMNTKNLYPYEIIRALDKDNSLENRRVLDVMWKNFDRSEITSKTIVVRDGSGSMYDYRPVQAIDVATSLAILFAEQLTGEFKNKFITFSNRPKLVDIKGETIFDKKNYLERFSEVASTNIEAVYNLILDVYKNENFNPDDALDRIVIISDMQFNEATTKSSKSTFENFKAKFEELGYQMPEMVFWNVRARSVQFPTLNDRGVKLVGGASSKIILDIIKNQNTSAYEFMLECLARYDCFDSIIF